jgi:gliding motility-associated-like protein
MILLLLFLKSATAQYLSNPSFEGIPMPHVPPPGWAICTFGNSTPDTQPGNFGVYTPPSHGNTYLGMTAREDFTWEDVHSVLITPLSVDSCYIFKIDMAFQEIVNGITMLPITLKIYGHNTICDKTNMLWQSPGISNEEWETHEFPISPTDFDITDIVLEVYYTDGSNPYWGYVLMDNIRITNEPNVDLGNDTTLTLCENSELVLNAGSGYSGYIWSNGSGDSTITVDTTGTYWVQVMNQYGCTASDTIEVIIEEYVEMVTQMIDSILVCEGQEVTILVEVLNGADPYSYAWQGLEDTTAAVTVIVDSTSYYVVEITDQCGNVIADSIKMVVADGPDIDLGDDLVVCFGEEVELSAGSGFASYLWQDGSQDSVYIATGPGWYWVTVSDAMGCVNTDSLLIEHYPEVQPDLGNDTLLCEIDNILLDAGSGWINYLWYDSTTLQTNLVSEPGSYWVIVEDINGCTGSDTIYVGLSPAVVVSLGGDTTVCSGDNYVLNPGANFTSYLWHDGSTGSSFAVTNPGTFWVSVTDENGCFGSDTVTVGLNPSPEVNLGNDTTLCTGNSLVLDPGTQYSSYLWQDNSMLPIFTVTTTGYYSITVTNLYNCPATDEIFVEVTSPSIDLGNDTLLCLGDTLYLDPGQGYMSYLWQDNSTGSIFQVTEGGTYSVEVSDIYACNSIESIEITELAKPVANLGGDQELCEGESLILETIEGPYSYVWNGETGNYYNEIYSGGTYMVEVTNQCGSESDQITITELPVPEVNLGPDQVLLSGESIQLNAGEGFDQYIWQDGTSNQYYLVSSDQADPDDPYYWVEVWDGPCKSSDTTRIELFKVKIPNVITPNGDGINDTFTPMEGSWSGVNRHHIGLFNRWGEKVWESDDFESGWDGKRNGTSVAEGTYFWVLDVFYGPEDIKQTIKGTVTVLGVNP